jgi:hypothetical protein
VALWDAIEEGDVERYASFLHPDYTVFSASGVYLSPSEATWPGLSTTGRSGLRWMESASADRASPHGSTSRKAVAGSASTHTSLPCRRLLTALTHLWAGRRGWGASFSRVRRVPGGSNEGYPKWLIRYWDISLAGGVSLSSLHPSL